MGVPIVVDRKRPMCFFAGNGGQQSIPNRDRIAWRFGGN